MGHGFSPDQTIVAQGFSPAFDNVVHGFSRGFGKDEAISERKMRSSALKAAIFCLSATLWAVNVRAAAVEGPANFPLVDGMTWKYESTLGPATAVTERVGDEWVLRSSAPRITTEQDLALGEEGVMLSRARSRIFFVRTERVYDPPLVRFPVPAEVGTRWEWEGTEIVDGKHKVQSRIVGVIESSETVEVPAGTFECLKVVVTTVSDDGTETESVQWVADGIGPVRIKVAIDAGGLTGFLVRLLGYRRMEFKLAELPVRPDPPPPSE